MAKGGLQLASVKGLGSSIMSMISSIQSRLCQKKSDKEEHTRCNGKQQATAAGKIGGNDGGTGRELQRAKRPHEVLIPC
jgi:hypothetical protein